MAQPARGGAREVDAPIDIIDHAPPAPISELWQRPDKAAVFMCGLPWSLATPRPTLVAAPRPSPAAYGGRACYWTDLVVRADSPFQSLEQTFGHRLALTTPESQSGYAAPLYALMAHGGAKPLYREIIEPRFTPMGALTAVIENKAEVAPLNSYALALLTNMRRRLPRRPASSRAPNRPRSRRSWPPARPRRRAAFLAAGASAVDTGPDGPLLLHSFAGPETEAYDALRERFLTMQAFWRRHPLAEKAHPLFAAELGQG